MRKNFTSIHTEGELLDWFIYKEDESKNYSNGEV